MGGGDDGTHERVDYLLIRRSDFLPSSQNGTAGSNELMSRFHYGKKDYFLGGHPLWELFRGTFQMAKKPYLVGGLALLLGYFWCWATRFERPVSGELMKFHRKEQLERLRRLLLDRLRLRR